MNRLLRTLALVAMLLGELAAMGQTDVTSSILNPGFDGRSLAGWRNLGFQTQTNNDFSGKTYKAYAERWVSAGNQIPDCYLLQTVTGLTNGQYRLTVAAHNINQNATSTAQSGAFIVGNGQTTEVTTSDTYSVDFAVVDGTAEIGLYTEGCTGNWVACDNFQLSRLSTEVSYLRNGLSALVTKANTLKSSSMQSSVLSTLNSAITNAQKYTSSGSQSNVESAYATLKSAIHQAENSIFYTKTSTGSGAPTVTTDARYAVGRNIAFGRSTVTGNNILEQGFCYSSTNSTPTVADERSKRYFDHVGYIHVMDNLTPGSVYYIRAYAVNTSYKVGYGEVLRIYTLPSGSFGYNFNASGDENIDARIRSAMDGVIGYWNQTTSITGFTPTGNYEAGVQTADCSYGGWIRFGPSEDYQATGTAMHEALHGIGVGTHSSWTSHESSGSYGTWYGKRAAKLTRFWDNNEGEFITGGGTHNWATNGSNMISYTINGAHEDAHTDLQYYGCGLLAQAMCEDGMVPAGGGFLPGYCFQHSDDTKYYIRNTNENYGLNTSTYLTALGTTLKWTTFASDEAAANDDKAAWYIDFDPATQYYYFKNASTGRYLYYNGTTFNVSGTAKNSYTQIHLHLGWWDATFGAGTAAVDKDTYYLMHPASSATPSCLTATSSNSLTTSTYSPAENQTAARWMILTMDETEAIASAAINTQRNKVLDIIEKVRTMAKTSHTDDTGSANTTLATTLSNIETAVTSATTTECEEYYYQVIAACKAFMQNTTPGATGYNITFLVADPGFDTGEGWNGSPVLGYSAGEAYQKTFDIYQTLTQMPTGRYVMKMQAYERPGTSSEVFTDYADGGNDDRPVTAQIYISTASQPVNDISVAAQAAKLGVGNEAEVSYNDVTSYLPNNMEAGANYFSKNYYDNSVETTGFAGGTLQFGIRNTTYVSADWSFFDNVRLYYFGGQTSGQDPAATADGYDITHAMAPYLSTLNLDGWTNNGFKVGTWGSYANGDARMVAPFLEQWANGTALGDISLEQTIDELPNGTYYIGGSFMASWQADASVRVTGATFYAGKQSIDIATSSGTPERYSLRVEVTDGTLTYGYKTESTNANWVGIDNLFLIYAGTEEEYLALASPSSPVRLPVANPRMEDGGSNDFPGWTLATEGAGNWGSMTATYDNFTGAFMESWTSSEGALGNKSATQTLTLPAGSFTLQAAVNATRQNDESLAVSGVTLFFAGESIPCHTQNGKPEVYQLPATLEAGDYELGLKLEDTNANWIAWDNLVLYYYGQTLVGDVNRDGQISIADVTALVNIILGKDSVAPYQYDHKAADVNRDGSISIADVTALVNIILGK
ncbi:MAG: dockerin type I repeat-containing protein [Bacteroidaceae bacterium]|nr:dockerin type I repeat-containing protein [Bacteroidaceae bacterium]